MKLNKRQLAHVLAALRFTQHLRNVSDEEYFRAMPQFADTAPRPVKPLNYDEVDRLCEDINCEKDDQTAEELAKAVKVLQEVSKAGLQFLGSDCIKESLTGSQCDEIGVAKEKFRSGLNYAK